MIPGLIAPPDKPTDHEHHARHRGGHGKKADQAFRTRWYRPDRLKQQRRQRQIKDEGIQPALLISTVAQQNLSDNTRQYINKKRRNQAQTDNHGTVRKQLDLAGSQNLRRLFMA